ncbi:NUDIX domain-containing protein [Candidatus Babeliales bacterium]|nr:NUDIX domain-containing protein [Candidatus Babeliales bacterium]
MRHQVVAYAIIIMRQNNKFLLIQRAENASFAPGHYSLIGGSLEPKETFRQALVREVREEIGVTINENDLHFAHTFHRNGVKHELVACVFECTTWQGEPQNKEPEKHRELAWFALDDLPEKIIPAHRSVIALIAKKEFYSEQP